MSFFYDLNKKLDSIRATPEVTHQQLNERDMSRAAKGYEKYGKQGMEALAKAGREGKALDPVRKKYDKYDNEDVDEGVVSTAKTIYNVGKNLGKQAASGINKMIGHGSDEDMLKRLDKDVGVIREPTTSKRPPYEPDGDNQIIRPNDPRAKQANAYFDKEVKEAGTQMTPKQRSFAKLAPPANKITFADKIAGAKKEVDEMLGDVAAEAMRSALSPKQKKIDMNKNGKLDANDFAMLRKGAKPEMDEAMPPRGKMTPSGKMTPKKFKAVFNGPLDWPRIVKFKDRLMGQGMEPEEAEQEAAERLGFEYEEVLDYLDLMNSTNEENDFTAHQRPAAVQPKVGSTERGSKHDIKHTATGRMVTRRTDAQGISVGGETDDEGNKKEKRTKAGRPDGSGKKIGAKGPSGKSKLMTREGDQDITDQGEYDQEGDMAKDDIKTIMRHAQALSKVLGDNDNLPEWVQSKLAKIEGMMISIDEYMQNQEDEEEPIAEKAVSKKQQRFMGMVHSAQKGEKPASRAVGKVANTMKKSDAEDFAKTKHKGLPEKAKKKEVDENSEDGKLTTTQTGTGKTLTTSTTGRVSTTIGNGKMSVKPGKPDKQMDDDTDTASNKDTSSKSNSMVGKGIYDSMNYELELMIAESMSINMSDSTEGNKSLTITATDEDAMKLAMILKSAGLGGHSDDMHSHGEEACDTCGMQDCGCGDVQEAVDDNAPDWPTNTETSNDALQYAGGLNKPKTDVAGDGQTTIPNTAVHTQEEDDLRRMMEMAGIKQAELEPWEQTMKEEVEEEVEEDFLESIQRMREIAGIQEAKKPDFLDMDKDGDKKEPMSKAVKDKEEKKVDESIFALTNQWKAYKG